MTGGQRYGAEVRAAQAGDALELARLLSEPATAMAERLDALRMSPGRVALVVTGYGGLAGLVALQWAPWLQYPRPVAIITALVVDRDERRRGIGRLLLKAASQAARAAGCDTLLLVAGDDPGVAAFCQASGFTSQGSLWLRGLRKRASEPPASG